MFLKDTYNLSSATPSYTDPSGGNIASPPYFKVMDQPIQEDIGISDNTTEYGFLKFKFYVPENAKEIKITIPN